MASVQTKFTIFLLLATILNICVYIFTFGVRINPLLFPAARKFSHLSSIISEKNEVTAKRTSIFKTALEGRLHSEGRSFEGDTLTKEGEGNKSERKRKQNSEAYRYVSLVRDKNGNIESKQNEVVKKDKEKQPSPEVQKRDGVLTAEKKNVEEQTERRFVAWMKNRENALKQGRLNKEGKGDMNDISGNTIKSGAFSEVGLVGGETKRPVNPHDFNYLINEPNKCKKKGGSDKNIFLLVLILSVHWNIERRNAIRQTWGSPTNIDGHEVITLFLLGKKNNDKLQRLVLEENEQYHDIIMEDFIESYKNLTLKTIMGMKWMSIFCAQTKFMMKTDDDMYVSYANIVNYLDMSPKSNFVTGYVSSVSPIRDPGSKWYVSRTTYNNSEYPPYCPGGGYILSGDVPPKIYMTSLSTPFFFIEDVYVGMCMFKLQISPKHHPEFHNLRAKYTLCNFRKIFTSHGVKPREMVRYWKDQTTNKTKC